MNLDELKEKIKAAGVIGAGGAGFPTHMKLAPDIDTVVVNAAECEPLLYTDFTIMQQYMDKVAAGAEAVCQALGAGRVVIGMKEHTAAKLMLEDGAKVGRLSSVKLMPDVYPMGDEIVLIYQTLGRVVPPGQLPSSVGVVVINVETAYNVNNSVSGIPVTEKWITVGGDIPSPAVFRVPVNCNVKDVFKAAGITVPEGHVVLDGGPAMGNIINPDAAVVTKKTKSLLILPDNIPAVIAKLIPASRMIIRTPSACCQCFHCTEICPRYLLGYPLEPHKTLRAAGIEMTEHPEDLRTASLCSGCGVCTLMACCQGVSPSVIMAEVKKNLRAKKTGYRASEPTVPNIERDNRLVPVDSFKKHIGVDKFDRAAPYKGKLKVKQSIYKLMLSQHAGKPSVPVVKAGDGVSPGQMVARADSGISAALHTPVGGRVSAVTGSHIEITVSEVG